MRFAVSFADVEVLSPLASELELAAKRASYRNFIRYAGFSRRKKRDSALWGI
jgi:hypothetical protein